MSLLLNNINWLYIGIFILVCIIFAGSNYIQKFAGKLALFLLIVLTSVAVLNSADIASHNAQTLELVASVLIVTIFALLFNMLRGMRVTDNTEHNKYYASHTFTPNIRPEVIVNDSSYTNSEQHLQEEYPEISQEGLPLTPVKPDGPTVLETLPTTAPAVFVAEQVDWNRVNKENKITGDTGERIVVAYEQNLLREAGHNDLAAQVEHTAQVVSDGTGYDVLSFFPDCRKKYIEVKSTQNTAHGTFFITHNELSFLQEHPDQAFVYCITEAISDSPKLTCYSAEQFLHFGNLTPAEYKFFV